MAFPKSFRPSFSQNRQSSVCFRIFRRMQYDYLGFSYALIVAAGGIIGFLKAGSIPSLISGISFGAIAAAGAYQTSTQPGNVIITLCASGLLTIVMGMRFYNSHKIFPAGVVFLLSLFMVGRCVWRMNYH